MPVVIVGVLLLAGIPLCLLIRRRRRRARQLQGSQGSPSSQMGQTVQTDQTSPLQYGSAMSPYGPEYSPAPMGWEHVVKPVELANEPLAELSADHGFSELNSPHGRAELPPNAKGHYRVQEGMVKW